MDYADAIVYLEEDVDRALARGEDHGLTNKEMADELRRIADKLEKE